jgi:hypothetical protein
LAFIVSGFHVLERSATFASFLIFSDTLGNTTAFVT